MESVVITLLLLLASCLVANTSASVPTARTVTFINQCGTDYFISPTSNAAPYAPGRSTCNSNADCEPGSSCLLPNTHICFYDVPTPTSGSFLVPAGTTNQIIFPFINNGDNMHWGGNFGFCGGDMPCTQTDEICSQQGCGVSSGPQNYAEITFQKTNVDFYDISNINGVNVPISISPSVIPPGLLLPNDPYRCGTPGSPSPVTSLGASSWEPTVPSVHYQWVVPSSTSCTKNSDCSNGDVCGLTNTPGATPQFKLSCGKLLGFWTADQVCGQDPTHLLQNSPFGCATPVVNGPYTTTLGTMQGCNGVSGSGYSNTADTSCCGCQDWYKIFGPEVVSLMTQNCTNSNPLWISQILPTIQWLKKICPSCYTYPYDDMSSTFVCGLTQNGYNTMNYTVTLCPSSGSATSPSTASAIAATVAPTKSAPTIAATVAPTIAATAAPTIAATAAPTIAATVAPTKSATVAPSIAATAAPTKSATVAPTIAATSAPAIAATSAPAIAATSAPTKAAPATCGGVVCAVNAPSCCNDSSLGPTCYTNTSYSCNTGSKGSILCGINTGACGAVCYDLNSYICCSNTLYSSTNTNAPCYQKQRRSLVDQLELEVNPDIYISQVVSGSSVLVCSWIALLAVFMQFFL